MKHLTRWSAVGALAGAGLFAGLATQTATTPTVSSSSGTPTVTSGAS